MRSNEEHDEGTECRRAARCTTALCAIGKTNSWHNGNRQLIKK
jgi:hypothetical protein